MSGSVQPISRRLGGLKQSTIDAANGVPIAFGEGSTFGPHLHVFGYAPIDIGTDCMFSSNVYVESGAGHDLEVDGVSRRPAPLTIGRHVWVGMNGTKPCISYVRVQPTLRPQPPVRARPTR